MPRQQMAAQLLPTPSIRRHREAPVCLTLPCAPLLVPCAPRPPSTPQVPCRCRPFRPHPHCSASTVGRAGSLPLHTRKPTCTWRCGTLHQLCSFASFELTRGSFFFLWGSSTAGFIRSCLGGLSGGRGLLSDGRVELAELYINPRRKEATLPSRPGFETCMPVRNRASWTHPCACLGPFSGDDRTPRPARRLYMVLLRIVRAELMVCWCVCFRLQQGGGTD